jgi:threonyl-tRNA synthetase
MLVVGDKEVEAGTVSVRHRKKADLGAMALEEALKMVQAQDQARSADE